MGICDFDNDNVTDDNDEDSVWNKKRASLKDWINEEGSLHVSGKKNSGTSENNLEEISRYLMEEYLW